MCCFAAGCADMNVPTPKQILQNPIGPNSAKIGMSKTQVLHLYGEPAFKGVVTSKDWGETREEWFYEAQMSGLPVNSENLSEDMYLYFDGDSLTNISNRSMATVEEIK